MVISCAQPCIQGISDPETAAEKAVQVNNQLAASISNNTARFGGFASLAMHNASVAAKELERTVRELGFLGQTEGWCCVISSSMTPLFPGALVNDYQQSGPDNGFFALHLPRPDTDACAQRLCYTTISQSMMSSGRWCLTWTSRSIFIHDRTSLS